MFALWWRSGSSEDSHPSRQVIHREEKMPQASYGSFIYQTRLIMFSNVLQYGQEVTVYSTCYLYLSSTLLRNSLLEKTKQDILLTWNSLIIDTGVSNMHLHQFNVAAEFILSYLDALWSVLVSMCLQKTRTRTCLCVCNPEVWPV